MRRCRRSSRTRYGTAPEAVLRLAEIDRPTIGDDEVLVRVAAASVDKGTWHVMTGLPYAMRLAGFGVRQPKAPNPGRSLAGTVESVGKDVTAFKPGDEVYGTLRGVLRRVRARQSRACSHRSRRTSRSSRPQPSPSPASTALQAVRKAEVQAGQHVLIIGASGGVGTFAVQIAKAFGAEVTGVCSTEQDRPRPLPRRRPRHRLHAARTSPPASTATTSSSTPAATADCHISGA